MKENAKKSGAGKALLLGLPIGLINGFFGSGGGIAAVFILKKFLDTEAKKAHATAISVILPLSAAGLLIYSRGVDTDISLIIKLAIGGVIGGVIGAKLLSNIPKKWLKVGFGVVMTWAGIRMVLR